VSGTNLSSGKIFINEEEVGSLDTSNNSFSFIPKEIEVVKKNNNVLKVVAQDSLGNIFEDVVTFGIK
jgi:hypothetical protein